MGDCARRLRYLANMGAPQNMKAEEWEDARHHRAFLLYAMQDPEKRSLRATARAVRASDNSVRKWRSRQKWEERLGDPEHCRHACDLYASTYHTKLGGGEVGIITERLGAEYVAPDTVDKSQTARAVDLYEEVDRKSALAAFNKETSIRNSRLRRVLNGTLARVGEGLANGKIQVRPSDLNTVVKGFELLERSEQRRLAMMPSTEDGENRAGSDVATSQRVLQAENDDGDILGALVDDAEELLLILTTLKTHEAESNVIPFDPVARAAKATG